MKTRFTCHRYFKFQSASPKNIFRAFSVQVPGANELNYSEADLKCLLNKSKVVKQIFLAKLGLLLLLPASYPVLGLTSAAGYASLLGLALVAFDKRATKAIKNAQIAKTVETNQIHLDIQK
jgi:hypothetical protein